MPSGATWSVEYPSGTYKSAPAGGVISEEWDNNPSDNAVYPQPVWANGGVYVPSPSSIQFPTSENPNNQPFPPVYTTTYTFYYPVTIKAGDGGYVSWSLSSGSVYGSTSGTVPAGSSATIYAAYGTKINLQAYPAYSWSFVKWTTSGSVSIAAGANPGVLTISGSGSVTANFGLGVTFTESGLPGGATWSVTFNGQTQSATVGPGGGTSITFYVSAPGSYSWSAPNVGWLWYTYYSNPSSGTMSVPSQTSQTITYSTNSFSYTWTPSGLTNGTWG
ncbi:MAG: hypothetical protein ACPL2E_07340, partial [Conexivisphaera sp.]